MGKKNSQVLGFRYYMGVHMGIGRGPLDEIIQINVDDLTAWSGSVTGNTTITIDQPDLFGGDKSEGGIVGTLDVMMGAPTQAVNSSLITMLGSIANAFRGRATLFFNGEVCALSPYPKPWKFRVRRATKGWLGDTPWYSTKAVISMASGAIKAMNPAHILYECATNSSWARGLSVARLDDTVYRAAADQLFSEGFGLCIKWSRTDKLSNFVQLVLDHIGATQYVSPTTGLLTLKLIRDDYDPATVPLFTYDTGLLSIVDDTSAAQSASTNAVIATYHDPITNTDGQVRVKNTAAIRTLGAPASTTNDYPGIPTSDLALRVAQRDLRAASSYLKRLKCIFDRRGYKITPGSAFRIAEPDRGIANLILRAGAVDYGQMSQGQITVSAIQDVFGLPTVSFVNTQVSTHVAADRVPHAATIRLLTEVSYRDLALLLSAGDLSVLAVDACFLAGLAARPSALSLNYDFETRVGTSGAFTDQGEGQFCPTATVSAINRTNATVSVTFASPIDLDQVALGTAAQIDSEIFRVDAIDPVALTATLARGCADTIAAVHSTGARIWFYDRFGGADQTDYAPSVVLNAKMLTRTSAGLLAEGSATTDSLTTAQRQGRPYPPGNVKVNGSSYPTSPITGDLAVTWAHRDRLTQADQLIDASESDVGPEAGVTYTLKIFSGVTLKRTVTAIATNNYTYLNATEIADGGPFNPIRFTLAAERGGLESAQIHDVTVSR